MNKLMNKWMKEDSERTDEWMNDWMHEWSNEWTMAEMTGNEQSNAWIKIGTEQMKEWFMNWCVKTATHNEYIPLILRLHFSLTRTAIFYLFLYAEISVCKSLFSITRPSTWASVGPSCLYITSGSFTSNPIVSNRAKIFFNSTTHSFFSVTARLVKHKFSHVHKSPFLWITQTFSLISPFSVYPSVCPTHYLSI